MVRSSSALGGQLARRCRVYLVAVSFLSLVAQLAYAAEPATHAASAATQIAEKARSAADLGHQQEAIEGFSQAYEMSGDSSLLFDIAEAHRGLGQETAALRMYQTYLRRDRAGAHREAAKKWVDELEKKGAGASDFVPPAIPVIPGGPTTTSPAAPAAPGFAPLTPASPPPFTASPAPPAWPASPSPAAQATTPAAVDLTANAGPAGGSSTRPAVRRWIPWVLAGATVALGAGAIAYGVSATNHYDDLSVSCGQTGTCTPSQIDQVKSRALKANVLWALAGGAAMATGIVVYVDARNAGLSALWKF